MSEQLTTATPTGPEVRAGELAARLEQANAEVIEFVQACPSGLWAARTPEEGWAVPAAAMHIAFGHLTITTWVHRLSAGLPVTETMADFAVVNAADEQKYANASQAEVVESLQTFGDAALRYVRGLTDKELEGTARFEPAGADLTAAQLVEGVLIGHLTGHFASIRAAAG
jgi:hypothetical protein